jgi:glycosyltransferase involved in cell wall biosynthesis
MKSLLIVTFVDFWRKGAGHRSRLSSLIDYIKDYLNITVAYAGTFNEKDRERVSRDYPSITITPLEPDKAISYKEFGELFREFMIGKTFDITLIEYIELSFVLPMLGSATFTILDTHDLVADRIASFRENKLPYHGITLTAEEELEVFKCFDRILLIQEKDWKKIGQQLDVDRVMLVPHATALQKRNLKSEAKNIGFVASEYPPNIDAIRWFLEAVWPSVRKQNNLTLNIYGNVGNQLPKDWMNQQINVKFYGFVEDLRTAYDHCDIMINPVKCGAGLKIKNVEALASGLPLITTSHGSIGMESGKGECFIVADTVTDFIDAIATVANDPDYRKLLSANAYAFAEKHFSTSACYQNLVNCMLEYELTE